MRLRRKLAAIAGTVIMGLGGAVALASPAQAYTYGPYQLRHISQYCLEMPGGPSNFGGQLILNYCGGPASHNQHVIFDDAGAAWLYFLHIEGSSYCLVPGNADLYHSTIIQWTCDYTLSRFKWRLTFPLGEGSPDKRGLQNVYQPAWCIDNWYPSAGAYLVMENCSTNYWNLISA